MKQTSQRGNYPVGTTEKIRLEKEVRTNYNAIKDIFEKIKKEEEERYLKPKDLHFQTEGKDQSANSSKVHFEMNSEIVVDEVQFELEGDENLPVNVQPIPALMSPSGSDTKKKRKHRSDKSNTSNKSNKSTKSTKSNKSNKSDKSNKSNKSTKPTKSTKSNKSNKRPKLGAKKRNKRRRIGDLHSPTASVVPSANPSFNANLNGVSFRSTQSKQPRTFSRDVPPLGTPNRARSNTTAQPRSPSAHSREFSIELDVHTVLSPERKRIQSFNPDLLAATKNSSRGRAFTVASSTSQSNSSGKRILCDILFTGGKWIWLTEKKNEFQSNIDVQQNMTIQCGQPAPFELIPSLKDAGRRIVSLACGRERWMVLSEIGKNKPLANPEQVIQTSTKFPREIIKRAWCSGSRVVSMSYTGGHWIVMTQSVGKPQDVRQSILVKGEIPTEELSQLWNEGKRVKVFCYGNGRWVIVSEPCPENEDVDQFFYAAKHFPTDKIKEFYKEKKRVHSIVHGEIEGIWAAILEPRREGRSQRFHYSTYFPGEKLKALGVDPLYPSL